MATALINNPAASITVMDRLRAVPGMKQLLLLLGLAAAIAGGLSLFTWAGRPAAQPVFAGLPESENAAIAEALTAEGIAHQVDAATGAVMVSAEQLRQARMALAGRGLPQSAATGFEMIAGEQGFGVSQSIESARMQHALETELVRTISAIHAVKTARVHLAIPKPSAFTRATGSASASVLVELYAGRSLNSQQVQSIVHMVASSVPEMEASAVTVIDQTGRLLTEDSAGTAAGMSNSQFEQIKRVEDATRHRVEDILAPLMGATRVRTQVVADLDFTAEEVTQEQYQPDPAAIRSEQTSEDISRSAATMKAQGVPGATSNKPPEPGASLPATLMPAASAAPTGAATAMAAAAAEPPSAQTRSSTRNYELNRTISHRKPAAGRIRRLNVAVLVDYLPKADAKGAMVATALTAAELGRIESLVKEAVGFDSARGDRVTVQNAPFVVEAIQALPPMPLLQRPELQSIARQGSGALLLLVLLLAVVRPLISNLLTAPISTPPLRTGGLAALSAPQTEDEEQAPGKRRPAAIPHQQEGPSAYEQKLTIAREAVKADPKKVAQVMKTWIAQE